MSAIARFSVDMTLRAPFMFQGLANARLGVDAAYLRAERSDVPIIPADQVKGVLSAACYTLAMNKRNVAPLKLVHRLFSEESLEGTDNAPKRGLLIISDLRAAEDARAGTTTRIEIDDETGAVKSGALQVVELAAPFGRETRFSGEIVLLARDVEVAAVAALFDRAIKLAPAIGAFKSAGFGEIVKASVSLDKTQPIALAAQAAAPELRRRAYRVTFDRPILVDATRETDNLFVGATIVPGAAFKGALAEKMRLAGADPENDPTWSEALAALRISHAFPENEKGCISGFALPASLLAWPDDDGVHFSDALLDGANGQDETRRSTRGLVAPQHPIDWKDKFFTKFGEDGHIPAPASIEPQPRTHVRIDPESLIATNQMLYTTVAQGYLLESRAPRAWRVVVDFDAVAEAQRGVLATLFDEEIFGVGRTGATATFKHLDAADDATGLGKIRLDAPPPTESLPGRADLHAITLITPALMTDPRRIETEPINKQYGALIAEQTGGELVCAFTSRRLAGGYIATRRRPYGKDIFYPFVLTEPGSVFLVRNGEPSKLKEIARFGFSPIALKGVEKLTWSNCPYIRENGYGEAIFSLVDHIGLGKRGRG